jgi:predicted nucleic-acid-binding protein
MAKSNDILKDFNENLSSLKASVEEFFKNQKDLLENYDILVQNQNHLTENHETVVNNQHTIIKNQGIITQNQNAIIHNQAVIVKNQAYLKTFLHTQSEILAVLTQKPQKEIAASINLFFENAQKEIALGFEKAVGE